jgi:ABC-type multidrug transport system ATPase subunit
MTEVDPTSLTEITLKDAGIRFRREWIFRHVSLHLKRGSAYAVVGHNGSGKSTLLQVIAGSIIPGEGVVKYHAGEVEIAPEKIYRHLSLAAPYMDLHEEFTLFEAIRFQQRFKKFRDNANAEEIIRICDFKKETHKQIRHFSSGMKQRLKLALAIMADTSLLLLDEPTSNLDHDATEWYKDLIGRHCANRIIVVCSNEQKDEYFFCKSVINVEAYK